MVERAKTALPNHLSETTAQILCHAQLSCDNPPTGLEIVFPVSPEGS